MTQPAADGAGDGPGANSGPPAHGYNAVHGTRWQAIAALGTAAGEVLGSSVGGLEGAGGDD